MFDRLRFLLLPCAVCCFAIPAVAQSTLSQNSGINSADTWVTLDLTTQTTNVTMTLPNPVYNPATGTTSNNVSITPPQHTFHVEAGYDSSGGLVMNLWPTGTTSNPYDSDASVMSVARYAGGQLTVFDQNGNPIPTPIPTANMPANWPFNLLGSGPSVLSGLVVPSTQPLAASLTSVMSGGVASLSVAQQNGSAANWTYAQSGANFIARQVTIPISTSNLTATRTHQFANVNWNDNAANDAVRAAKSSTGPALPSSGPIALSGVQADPAFTPESTTIPSSGCSNTNTFNLGGSQNIAFVHGIFSSGCTWQRMANWLNGDFLIGKEVIPSWTLSTAHNSFSPIEAQASDLETDIKNSFGENYILIGHSQGGLVSRYAAQAFQNTLPGTVSGVVTIDTPHQGANLISNINNGVGGLLQGMGSSIPCVLGGWDCVLGPLLTGAGSAIESAYAIPSSPSSWFELEPNSAFLKGLNYPSTPESFKQAAIIGSTPQRFAFTRIIANVIASGIQNSPCNPEDGTCGEEAIAADTEYFYLGLGFAEILAEEAGTWNCIWVGGNEGGGGGSQFGDGGYNPIPGGGYLYCYFISQPNYALADAIAQLMSDMDAVDSFYNNVIDLPDTTLYKWQSDAIVQMSSQFYPSNTAIQQIIPVNPGIPVSSGADSHTGATKSGKVHSALDSILAGASFRVPVAANAAGCKFSVSNSPDFVGGASAQSSFGVTAGAGCQWSATSTAPWLTITSNVNGVSNGVVQFSIAANPSTMPRTGYIEAGNQFSTPFFTVNQAGICTYSLSEGPEVAVPAAGINNSTVQVSTQQSCPWSSVPTVSWITVSPGTGSGTGSGSFTWSAAANTTDTDRTGAITVANQTLTVVDGNPVGAPGKATITIGGSPQSYSFYPCPSNCSAVTVPEGGTVTVTVGGQTFNTTYGGQVTASTITSALASEMNSPLSLVSATVISGTTISIQSAINGAATNYTLSTSSTFNPSCSTAYNGATYCFTTPAFTSSASGSQLSGGTD